MIRVRHAVLLFLALLPSCSPESTTPALSDPNILIISVDTLRADRLGCYGYKRNATPTIDRWAEEGTLFTSAYTEVPLTLPAHTGLFTGLYPVAHGVRENAGYEMSPDFLTLAERMQEEGWATGGFVGSYVLASEFGVSQGFDYFDEDFEREIDNVGMATAIQRPASEVVDAFLNWARRQEKNKWFAFLHFYDPHTPRPRGYDAEVSLVDRELGRLQRTLSELGLEGKTDILFVSDHGEALGEHGESGHGFFLYDSTLRIPFMIRPAPDREAMVPGRMEAPVSLVDVFQTVESLAGLPLTAEVHGRNLWPVLQGGDLEPRGLYAETYVPDLHFGWSPLRSLRKEGWKLIEAPRPELYDLSSASAESSNLYHREAERAEYLEGDLENFVAEYSREGDTDSAADREEIEKLAALGYVSFSGGQASDFGEGVDPKDRIEVFEEFHALLEELSAGRLPEGVFARLSELEREAPETRALAMLQAKAHELSGRYEEAETFFDRAMEEAPENNYVASQRARNLIRLQEFERAEEIYEEILEQDPGDFRTRNNFAGLLAMQGREDEALGHLRRVTEDHPDYAAGWQNLAQIQAIRRNWSEARSALLQVLRMDRLNARAHVQMGHVLRALGRAEEAAEHFRRAAELDPRLAER